MLFDYKSSIKWGIKWINNCISLKTFVALVIKLRILVKIFKLVKTLSNLNTYLHDTENDTIFITKF